MRDGGAILMMDIGLELALNMHGNYMELFYRPIKHFVNEGHG